MNDESWSGRRESNPVYMHPMHVYCRYTTARNEERRENLFSCRPNDGPKGFLTARKIYLRSTNTIQHSVGAPRIELGLYAPEAYVLPVYYAPTKDFMPRNAGGPSENRTRASAMRMPRRTTRL